VGHNTPIVGAGEEIAPGTIIEGFEIVTPLNDEICRSHIDINLKRGLKEAVRRRTLHIVAAGPSARLAGNYISSLPTLALNSSLKLFTDWGIAPTYWACCDPQELVADFLPDNPSRETIYFVASKCHSRVFEKLKGCDVRIWHLRDYPADGRSRIALCSTVTLSASWLMHRLGYTDFEYWGWDGCFIDGKHHATVDDDWSGVEVLHLNYGGTIEGEEVIGGRVFSTTRSWASEAKDAEQFFMLAEYFDIGLTIHGDGMFACAHKFSHGEKG